MFRPRTRHCQTHNNLKKKHIEEEKTDTDFVYFTVIRQWNITYKVCLGITFKNAIFIHVAC